MRISIYCCSLASTILRDQVQSQADSSAGTMYRRTEGDTSEHTEMSIAEHTRRKIYKPHTLACVRLDSPAMYRAGYLLAGFKVRAYLQFIYICLRTPRDEFSTSRSKLKHNTCPTARPCQRQDEAKRIRPEGCTNGSSLNEVKHPNSFWLLQYS